MALIFQNLFLAFFGTLFFMKNSFGKFQIFSRPAYVLCSEYLYSLSKIPFLEENGS